MQQNTTQEIFNALQRSGATSVATGLTAAELAAKFGFDKKIASTVLGNLKRTNKARRVQEMRDDGYTHEYRYWVAPGAKVRFYRGRQGNGLLPEANDRRAAEAVKKLTEQYHGAGGYLMQIKGPNNFRMEVELAPGKLPQVIRAANGGE